jgi:hypothetical protein
MAKRKINSFSFVPLLSFVFALLVFLMWQNSYKTSVLGTTTETKTNKELYVPLGIGFSDSTDWTNVEGVAAYVDSTNFARMKKVTFEATLYQPRSSQRIWVRLLNSTDGRVIANTELSTDSTGPVTLISSNVTLDYGNKNYQVQMKTQLGGLTNLNQARIHIITY